MKNMKFGTEAARPEGLSGAGILRRLLPLGAALAAAVLFAGASEAANRLEEIKKRGFIEIATEPYFAPNEFIDPTKSGDDKYVGSDIELARYIGKKLGVDVKIVPLEFTAVLTGVTEGKYDMAISALAYTPVREEAMNLSKGYYFSKERKGHGILIRESEKDAIKGPEDLTGKIVVVQSASLQELFAQTQIPKDIKELKRVSATTDIFLSVQEKKADACLTAVSVAEIYINNNSGSGLMIVEGFQFAEDESTLGTRIGIPKGEKELTDAVNAIIDELRASGQYEKWYDEYTAYAQSLGIN
jgi:polar amino acid transport system substrate-binding protein